MTESTDHINYVHRKIMAKFIAQNYRHENDDYPIENEPLPIDVTEKVLSMEYLDVIDMLNFEKPDVESIDNLVPVSIIRGRAFRVDGLEESICSFFMLDEHMDASESLSEDAFNAARAAHRIGEEKTYLVDVNRTITQQLTVKVQALSRDGAEEEAIKASADCDFNNGTQSDPIYDVEDVRIDHSHPKPHNTRPKAA